MPIPTPSPEEKESDFMSRCMSAMADEDPNMDNKQRVAVCFDSFKKSKKKGESMDSKINKEKSVKRDELGRIIVAEGVKITFSGNINFIQESEEKNE